MKRWLLIAGGLLLALLVAAACARATTPPVTVTASQGLGAKPIRTLAILPSALAAGGSEASSGARETVTELVAQAASREGPWRIVEPESVALLLRQSTPPRGQAARAAWVAEKLGADATLTAEVHRFRERVGSDYGASEPASVGLTLLLVAAGADAPMWQAEYSFTQLPLSYNLWNVWGVLRGGPKWLTAGELARIGIDEAVSRLVAVL
ncbi:MAG: hypothetical protein ACREQ9_06990 [Candidatus Binatia bacterium]